VGGRTWYVEARRHDREVAAVALCDRIKVFGFCPVKEGRPIVAALDEAPFTRCHALLLAVLFAALVFDYSKPFTLGFVIPGVRDTWGLSAAQAAFLPVAGLVGTVVGSFVWGFLGDRIGRRPALLWTVGLFSVGSLCGLSQAYWNALLACLIMGFGVGGEAPITFALAAEYTPTRQRAKMLLVLGLVGSLAGYALAAGTAAVIKSFLPEEMAWRLLWLVGILPAVLILVMRSRIVPESARYLIEQGRIEEARKAAEHLVGPIPAVAAPEGEEETPSEQTPAAPRSNLYGRTVALSFFGFAWGLANFGFVTWIPTLLGDLGYAAATSSAYLALAALLGLPALAITTLLFTRWSTRWTLATYAVGGGLSLVLVGLGASRELLTPLFLVLAAGLAFFFITSIGGAFPLYAAEVFPTAIRGQRSGIVAGLGKLGGVVGPYFGGLWLAADGSVLGLQAALAGALLTAAVVLASAGVETRGRTLEQIIGGH
jgi:putative MFS transporter